MFLIILVNIFYGLVCPIGKIALRYTTPLFVTGFRMVLSSILVLGYQYIFKRPLFKITRAQLGPLIMGGICMVYLSNWLEFYGLEGLSPAKAAFLYNLYPFAAALISWGYLGHRLSNMKWLGLAVGVGGALPLLIEDSSNFWFSLYDASIIGAVFAAAFGWIFIQRATRELGCDSTMANGVIMLIGGVLAFVHSGLVDTWNPVPVTNTKGFLISALALMICANLLLNPLYIKLLKRYSLTFLSFTAFSVPLFTAVLDWFMLGLRVSYTFYIATFIMGVGFYLFYKEDLGL